MDALDTSTPPVPAAQPHIIKNIQYRNILYNTTSASRHTIATEAEIDAYITDSINAANTAKLPWNKLQKTTKIEKLTQFAERVAVDKKYTADETKKLVAFFKNCLDNKQLQRIKDVHYDVEKGAIINIPILLYNKTTQRYTLKNTDKHAVTHKSTKQTVEPVQIDGDNLTP